MKTKLEPLVAAFVLALLAAGCSTVDPAVAIATRIKEKADVYAKLTPDQQKAIKAGSIEYGYTPDMVYMAMGQPAKVQTKDLAAGKVEMWTYVLFTPVDPTAQNNINNPDSAHYATGVNAANSPDVSADAPQSAKPTNTSAASGATAQMQPLDLPDMKTSKLLVFIANGRVAGIKYDESGL